MRDLFVTTRHYRVNKQTEESSIRINKNCLIFMMSPHSERQSGHKLNDYCFLKTLKNQFINILSKKENKLHLSKSKVSYFDDVII